ncbi:hypothetical protein PGTUg99_018151 [Puccinia graminis f. sp. tritici]|uniref:Pentulose kinase n=2 Tax=Puccinia graminis f. sp. tritici TaxID=56615 RepID=E3KTE3_PUCGT|nr:uncharacterized protein PGTG_13939 [Puccinia graminis f. sp. tritici CRL 75-36-700-3]EFP87568.2 hypothetical protein PGTG_13939 [Puccinia graminis f. sp. tritici CRL 75-36-700-3]KAA1130648.1 hypothetical protein PGTUg99_018151 [Puccinia graminis f. sp. tritici]
MATDRKSNDYYIGVDVGTGSARAALVACDGEIVAESTYPTTTYRDDHNHDIFEQSTTEIWNSIAKACKDCLRDAKVGPEQVKGIGFDATCSLAVSTFEGEPMSITQDQWGPGESKRNIILWADHRARDEANLINSSGSPVLQYVGGTMSLEMEIPKVLWLKRHMPEQLFKQSMFFDLPDFLTYRATGNLARSNCSLACKCSYVPPEVEGHKGWNDDFFKKIGLPEFVESDFKQVGGSPGKLGLILTAGQPVGSGLTAKAASELGLLPNTPVGSGVIDAYAGWIGVVAAKMEGEKDSDLGTSQHRLCVSAGTSSCHIVQSPNPVFVPGVWGPYLHAVFPGYWMNEGGQSSTGQLLDFIIDTHPAVNKVKELAQAKGVNHFVFLNDTLKQAQQDKKAPFLTYLTKDYYLYPDLHGNRSPLADNAMKGMLIGMSLDKGVMDLALRYFITCEAIALQTRQIVDKMNDQGHKITAIFMSGGLVKNAVLMQLIANICNVPIQLPASHSASVVLGSAMLGKAAYVSTQLSQSQVISKQDVAEERAHQMKDKLWEIMVGMSRPGTTIKPHLTEQEKKLLNVKYKIFNECIDLQRKWRKDVQDALS